MSKTLYRLPEACFEVPQGYLDQSITVLNLMSEDALSLRTLITRARVAAGTTVGDYAEKDITFRRSSHEAFELLWRRSHSLDGRPALIISSRTEEQGEPMAQRHMYVIDGETALTIAFTTSGDFTASQLDILGTIGNSFTFWERP